MAASSRAWASVAALVASSQLVAGHLLLAGQLVELEVQGVELVSDLLALAHLVDDLVALRRGRHHGRRQAHDERERQDDPDATQTDRPGEEPYVRRSRAPFRNSFVIIVGTLGAALKDLGAPAHRGPGANGGRTGAGSGAHGFHPCSPVSKTSPSCQ